jgi:predicted transcriptional regulator
MAILMKIRYSILVVMEGKPIGITTIEGSEFSRRRMRYTLQIKRLDMMLDSEI